MTNKGSVLLTVNDGKLLRTLDLRDWTCRQIIHIGVPFPIVMEPKIVLKRSLLDKQTFKQWQAEEATRCLNNYIAQKIAHPNDHASLVLIDSRFKDADLLATLHDWAKPCV